MALLEDNMKLERGDMWTAYETAGLFLFTANSILDKDLKLVMGAGMAGQVRGRFPTAPQNMGKIVANICGSGGAYFLLISKHWPSTKIGAFQVKYNWKHKADLDLIAQSTTSLKWWAKRHHDTAIHLNFPGIGEGKRSEADVMPIISELPDNVHVWRY